MSVVRRAFYTAASAHHAASCGGGSSPPIQLPQYSTTHRPIAARWDGVKDLGAKTTSASADSSDSNCMPFDPNADSMNAVR